MDYLILAVFVIISCVYLYHSFFKKKGCGCGSKECGSLKAKSKSQDKTDGNK